MTFLTYAQNFEDVLLWRALKHIKNGFYIDVGANDPELHSVTKAFYDAGWWGINIEPMPSYQQVFAQQRPRDINLALAAGAAEGEITLFDTPDINGWASTDRGVAEAHRAEGVAVVEVKVPLRTLNTICAEHVRGDIHFLKIDVEGFEADVLRGVDLQRWRPWLLVVEATLPNSRQTNHEAWEGMITSQRYQFAYFDGLNRYYVADEHAELLPLLGIQANVFDDFISCHLDQAWKHAKELGAALHAAEARAQAAEAQAHDADQRLVAIVASANQAINQTVDALERLSQADARKNEAERHTFYHEARANQAEQATLDALQRLAQAQAEAMQAETALAAAKEETAIAYTERQGASVWGHNVERQLLEVYASSSWRLTAPLRKVARLQPAASAKAVLRRALRALIRREGLRRPVLQLLSHFPALEAKVRSGVATVVAPPSAEPLATVREAEVPQHLVNLTASARRVLADLQRGRSSTPRP